MSDFEALLEALDDFVTEREWGKFHTPRNLALALGGEVGELQAEVQWIGDEEIEAALGEGLADRLGDEAADVLIYLLLFARTCRIDLVDAARGKLVLNAARYRTDVVRGRADKALRDQ